MQKITECAALLAHGRRQNIRPRSKGLAYEYYEVDLLMNARATRDDLRAPLLAAAAAAGVLAALAFEVAPRVPACHSAHSLWRGDSIELSSGRRGQGPQMNFQKKLLEGLWNSGLLGVPLLSQPAHPSNG